MNHPNPYDLCDFGFEENQPLTWREKAAQAGLGLLTVLLLFSVCWVAASCPLWLTKTFPAILEMVK